MVTCWSDDETVALINAYRNKWYSLRRSNLRPPDWQEVTDAVAFRCPESLPPKTSDQCCHKMQELRRRYRAELQRIRNPNHNHNNKKKLLHKYFKLMDCLESGVDCSDPSVERIDPRMEMDRNSEDDIIPLHSNGIKQSVPRPLLKQRVGVRIKFPNTISDNDVSSSDIRRKNGSGKNGSGGVYIGGVKRKGEGGDGDVTGEMMGAIKRLGDGFVKMEGVKMDMARELEIMRIKMESERMGIVIETQRKVCNLFVKTVSEKKKKIERMVTPET